MPNKLLKVALVFLCSINVIFAQTYPTKPIRIIIPFPPGGGSDAIIRVFAPKFSEFIGQPIIIDNRSGANGNVGTEAVARSSPDGYSLLFNGSGTLAINPSLYSKLPYDVVRDFSPISLMVFQPHVLVLHPSVPAKSVKELIALARSHPGKLNYASSGNGSLAHLGGQLFKTTAHLEITHIPYKGAAPSLIDLIAGQVHMVFSSAPSVIPHIKNNKLRPIGVTTLKRISVLPEVPSLIESGVDGFILIGWYGMLAPTGTPINIIGKLNNEILATLTQISVRQKLNDLGLEIEHLAPSYFNDLIKSEISKYSKVIQSGNIRIE